jgi:hypothetical protein
VQQLFLQQREYFKGAAIRFAVLTHGHMKTKLPNENPAQPLAVERDVPVLIHSPRGPVGFDQ